MRHLFLPLLFACGSDSEPPPTSLGTSTGQTAPGPTGTTTGQTPPTGAATGAPAATDPWLCAPLDRVATATIPSGDVSALVDAVNNASPGDVIGLEDGTYDLNGEYLWFDVDDVTLVGLSGDSGAVVLDGGYVTTEIITTAAHNITIAHLTTLRAYTHGIHATGGASEDVSGAVIYDVRVVDPGEQAIKVNQTGDGRWTDDGLIACSHLELTDAGRPQIRNNCYTGGVDAHATNGWTFRDNTVVGFWCDQGLSEHGIHLWRKNANSLIERNTIIDCARGIGLGLVETPGSFDRDHGIDCGPLYVDDIRGTVVNNLVYAQDAGLFASASGFDSGIGVYAACDATVAHNTVWSTADPFSSIEWRFDATTAFIENNLSSHNHRERTAGIATVVGNLEYADATGFVDADGGNLHLTSGASAVDAAVPGTWTPLHDLEGSPRDTTPDVGALEL